MIKLYQYKIIASLHVLNFKNFLANSSLKIFFFTATFFACFSIIILFSFTIKARTLLY